MHANYILGMRRFRRNLCDGNGRGIRGQDCRVLGVRSECLEHGLFHLELFIHSLHNKIRVTNHTQLVERGPAHTLDKCATFVVAEPPLAHLFLGPVLHKLLGPLKTLRELINKNDGGLCSGRCNYPDTRPHLTGANYSECPNAMRGKGSRAAQYCQSGGSEHDSKTEHCASPSPLAESWDDKCNCIKLTEAHRRRRWSHSTTPRADH
mmetsp:Transcript_51619/g.136335  ORF Transcript_51619/g.136335 Transcript_51619/m.136335 type:complete len:207 (-) Transcript_51619:84-704(-)